MEQNLENKQELKANLNHFYNKHKTKIYVLTSIIILILISLVLIKNNNEKKNIQISEKYIKAGIYLAANKKDQSKDILEEIILSKNKFYSILALNTIIEKNLISDKDKINDYFEILEKSALSKNQEDLIILKKALYKIRNSDVKIGENYLNKLIENDSILKPLAQELIKN